MSAPARISGYRIEGHAIVSEDERIAGPDGRPAEGAQQRGRLAPLPGRARRGGGRPAWQAQPRSQSNRHRRNRLVVSSSAGGVERRGDDGWWWNPAEAPLGVALKSAAPEGGIVAVPGGHLVFDLLLKTGFDAFHLARMAGVRLPGGVPLFSAIDAGWSAADVLAGSGLRPGPVEVLDAAAGVTLVTWRPSAH
ncbi:MAG: hypothetical protein WDM84_00845 [Bauldia sp.]